MQNNIKNTNKVQKIQKYKNYFKKIQRQNVPPDSRTRGPAAPAVLF